jgi:GT2 family glycosyltransferase
LTSIDKQIQAAVVIATKNRLQLLSERAIPSLLAQTRPPSKLIVVDDSDAELRAANGSFIQSLVVPGCEVSYLENSRTDGASGSWNSGIDYLTGCGDDPSRLFVAFLDDDDSWDPAYLESCLDVASESRLDMVAADFRRHESGAASPALTTSPPTLAAADFLTANPGIQGSNLFVRLSVLLAAGGFDEALPSTTDRDLCIRIADLGTVRYARIPIALVDHFADSDRSRLSTPASPAKLEGLSAFWRKYRGRMSPEQQQAFQDRAVRLFAWCPPADHVAVQSMNAERGIALILGLPADADRPVDLLRTADALTQLHGSRLIGLDVVLLEKGAGHDGSAVIEQVASKLRAAGVGCFTFPLSRQRQDAANGLFRAAVCRATGASDKTRRRMLHLYCSRAAIGRTGAETWLAEGSGAGDPPRPGSDPLDMLRWLRAVPAASEHLHAWSPSARAMQSIDEWIHRERVATAMQRVQTRWPASHLRVLGQGSEAVVFTDGCTVYKCIDYWKTRMPRQQLKFLQEQAGRWKNARGLYPLREVLDDGRWAIITYDFEESTPYEGGHEADLIALLDACRRSGVVCNNIHPKNLVVTASEVKLIDYGSDIRAWTPLGFEHMARRAFLASRHATRPDLDVLMRRCLLEDGLAELAGYEEFKRRLTADSDCVDISHSPSQRSETETRGFPFRLLVGVITREPSQLRLLLRSFLMVRPVACVRDMTVLVLDNGCPHADLADVIREARADGVSIAVIDEAQQRSDAAAGGFGACFGNRPRGQAGIAQARTMLQRYLGAMMEAEPDSIGWILDDDMRVDDRATAYLPWLPAFRAGGVDALLGAYEGSSPNTALHGLRVQLVDLLHNLHWLDTLAPDAALPNRAIENAELRARFPDYYYDLSRKHSAHLEVPFWIEPRFSGETVREARARLLADAPGLLRGAPLTRPIIVEMPSNPIVAAQPSVNRGGCTFVLNHRALTETPNLILSVHGGEARRSDMIWAILNRHYRRMTIKSVGFPILHFARGCEDPKLDVRKVQAEIVGSTLYAALADFLRAHPHHELQFSAADIDTVCRLADAHLGVRLRMLEQSLRRIAGLRDSLRRVASADGCRDFLAHLDNWASPETLAHLRSGIGAHEPVETRRFLSSLRAYADDFAAASVQIDFVHAQRRRVVDPAVRRMA